MITSKYPCALLLYTGLSITPCFNSFYTSKFVRDVYCVMSGVYCDGECLSFENQITQTSVMTVREYVGLSGWCICMWDTDFSVCDVRYFNF